VFEYTITDEDTVKCVCAKGRVDSMSAQDIQKAFDRLILSGERVLLVDMGAVNYVSSAGLRVFLSSQRQLKKVQGEIVLAALTPPVLKIFEMSGLTTVFRILNEREEISRVLRDEAACGPVLRLDLQGLHMEYTLRDAGKGALLTVGSQAKTTTASYGPGDVVSLKAAEMHYGCGFAALGDSYDEYKGLFGESMAVEGSFFFFPAIRHAAVDYLINAAKEPETAYRFFHGFGFNGPPRYVLTFEAGERPVDLKTLLEGFLTLSEADVLGVTLIAESKGIWGMHLKKVPLFEQKPQNGKPIFATENFAEWVDFPVEPAFHNHVVVATGLVLRDPRLLKPEMQSLVSEKDNFHIHGGIFEKGPISRNTNEFSGELLRIFHELQVYKIQHLLGRSVFSGGMASIVELEA
jgi:anti-anti-sigma factor